MTDKLTRFLFDNHSVRGELVQLSSAVQSAITKQNYPIIVSNLLGEMLAASSLLVATLKIKGEISLQIQSEGYVKYAVVHATHKQKLKAVARIDNDIACTPDTFSGLFKKGYLVITITPEEGERYQGIIGLEKDNLAQCIEDYFIQSEQLPTKLYLFADTASEDTSSAGLFLQVIPASSETSMQHENEAMDHLSLLAQTVTSKEIFGLSSEELLYRLFHQEVVRILNVSEVEYHCDCSKSRTAQALKSIDSAQLDEILKEDGVIKMHCHFCQTEYVFDEVDIKNIQAGNFSYLQADDENTH